MPNLARRMDHESPHHRHSKSGVLDPQGKAIESALGALGVPGVASLRQGKVFDVEIAAADKDAARANLTTACEKLLANTVIENYAIEL